MPVHKWMVYIAHGPSHLNLSLTFILQTRGAYVIASVVGIQRDLTNIDALSGLVDFVE